MAVVIRTLKSSGGDYSSLSAWQNAEQTDLVAAGDQHILEVYKKDPPGSWGALTMVGWTTGPNNYVTITVPESERWDGIDTLSGAYASGRWYLASYTQVEFMVMNNGYFAQLDSNINVTVKSCATKNTTEPNAYLTLENVYSCLAQNGGSGDHYYVCKNMHNCVSINAGNRGFVTGLQKNCISYGASGVAFTQGATGSDYCASDDTTAPGANSFHSITSAEFNDFAGGDYSLAAGSQLILAGTNLYSTFTQDILGVEWPAAGAWDIGAFRYGALPPTLAGVIPILIGKPF